MSGLRYWGVSITVSLSLLTAGCGPRAPHEPASNPAVAPASGAEASTTLTVEIDFGTGRQQTSAVPWRADITAIEALAAALEAANLKLESRGAGGTAFVEAIDGIHNEVGSKEGRNWLFKVNGRLSPAGAGAVPLKPGDRVLWQYRVWE